MQYVNLGRTALKVEAACPCTMNFRPEERDRKDSYAEVTWTAPSSWGSISSIPRTSTAGRRSEV